MLKAIKKPPNYLFLFKIITFIGVCTIFHSHFNQLKSLSHIQINSNCILPFLCCILLMPLNIYLEYLKWTLIVKRVIPDLKSTPVLKTHLHPFLAGIITGFITPNLLGNFIGRIYYYAKEFRSHITTFTLLANGSQFLASITFGLISIGCLGISIASLPSYIKISILFLITLCFMGYLFIEKLPSLFKSKKFIDIDFIKDSSIIRVQFISLSIFRHLIFSIQFLLLFKTFSIPINLALIGWIWQVYFFSTLIPSLWFGKLGIRESIALLILSPILHQATIILCCSFLLWILNQVIPTLFSLIVINRKKNEFIIN